MTVNGETWSAYSGSGGGAPNGSGGGYTNDVMPASPTYEHIYIHGTLAQIGAYSYQGIGSVFPTTTNLAGAVKFLWGTNREVKY